jgi:predicted transposase YbfD/YdcC
MDYTNLARDEGVNAEGLIYDLGSLYTYLEQVKDTRLAKGKRYPLAMLLILMLLAKFGGEDQPSGIAEWVAHRQEELRALKLLSRARPPSHMTYRRILQRTINPSDFEVLISEYQRKHLAEGKSVVFSLDGKTMRGTIPGGEMRGTHLLSIFVPDQGLVLAQAAVDSKENEIVVAPTLLKQVSLKGCIVLADAMHTQRSLSEQIVEAGGDFVWVVKDNQPRTRWAIEKLFVHEMCNLRQGADLSKEYQMGQQVDKGHGRITNRKLYSSTLLNDYLDWPHVAQVFRVERTVYYPKHKGKTREIVYGLTSLSLQEATPAKLLALIRQHWQIESGLHYRRDVTLREDATRLTVGNAGHNMAILNNLVVSLCLRNGFRNIAQARRRFNAKPKEALMLIVSAKSPTL